MPNYRYSAMNAKGRVVRGFMEANHEDDLESRLSKIDLDLINFKIKKVRRQRIALRRITRKELLTFCFHLEQVMDAGIPLLEGLSDLRESSDNPAMRAMLTAMIEEISGGGALTQALAIFPQVFDEVFRSLIAAGETTGNVAIVLRNLADDIKWQDELAAKTRQMMIYPTFVGIIITAIFFFMMVFLVPQLITFIKIMEMELPFHTQLLIATSDFVIAHWPVLIGTPIGLYMLISWMMRVSPTFARWIDFLKLRTWIFGPILQRLILARFASVFALMYASGITVLECLEVSRGVMGNRHMTRAIENARDQISQGHSIGESFKLTGVFPPLVLRMIAVGESTGSLDKGLRNVRYFYDREAKDAIDRLQSMIQPVMTLILGGLLAWVILSVLGPIYDIMTQVKT
ncbi:MAG: type II secretion system F family protein [Magnetococcales bacterium]|nr:type II secretion system F family protein [Magnetococcales bacterium]